MHNLELSPQSKKHIESLFEFYESQQKGRGASWMASFIDELDRLEQNPKLGAYLTKREEGIRYFVTQDRFKTVIIYRVDSLLIKVSGIYDSRSNWK